MKHSVLFICIHNSARSQMAEAFLKKYGQDYFSADSAGLEPGKMNKNVVTVMNEIGIDLSQKPTKGVFEIFQSGQKYDGVITVCDAGSAERCPVFPGKVKREAWSFSDPSSFTGSQEEILQRTRGVRDEIETKIKDYVNRVKEVSYWV